MNKNIKTILNCFGIAILALIIVNLISFGIEIAQTEISKNWSFLFEQGTFYIDDKPTGLIFGSAKANGFMMLIFLVALFGKYRKGKLPFNN